MAKSRRYSRIIEATRYYAAIDNLIKYWSDSTRRGTNVGQGEPRPPSQLLYVVPFGVSLATGQMARQSAAETAWQRYGSQFNNYTDATQPVDAGNVVKLADYAAARVIILEGRSNTGTVKTSAVTGMKYLSYGGSSTSIPFGRSVGTDTIQSVYDTIANNIRTANQQASLRLSLKLEVS